MKKNKYVGSYAVGSSYSQNLMLGNNLRVACKMIRKIALDSCSYGDHGVWSVRLEDGTKVAMGLVGRNIHGAPIRFGKVDVWDVQ